MEQIKEIDIDLRKVMFMMRKKVIFVIIIGLVCGLGAGLYTHFFIPETYTASVTMNVYSNTDRVSTDSTITYNEITTSKELVDTYIVILESDTVLQKVIDDLGLSTTTSALKSTISAESINETAVFKVSVSTKNAELSEQIANSIAKIAPDEIVRVLKAGGVEVVDEAKVPSKPSSPNIKKNILISAFAGLAISFIIFFIFEVFDTTITSEKDIEREFDIPILGTVPKLGMTPPNKGKKETTNGGVK